MCGRGGGEYRRRRRIQTKEGVQTKGKGAAEEGGHIQTQEESNDMERRVQTRKTRVQARKERVQARKERVQTRQEQVQARDRRGRGTDGGGRVQAGQRVPHIPVPCSCRFTPPSAHAYA